MKAYKLWIITLLISCLCVHSVHGRDIVKVNSVGENVVLKGEVDYHISANVDAIAAKCVVDLYDENAWLFFDGIKPNDVLAKYSDAITISGKQLKFGENARISLYGTGTVVMAHGADYSPLTTYENLKFGGNADKYTLLYYYTNCAPDSAPARLVKPLSLDNKIRSFKLKRGYMATLATNPDGMGYSRVYIADTADLEVAQLPLELDKKVSYIRVFKWNYATKKGWAGSYWKDMPEGLKYAPEQANKTNSTWYYNWGSRPTINPLNATKNYNQEYVPEKWGAGGMWNSLYTIEDACHLIGYNEPDHSEQSNVSVEKAIEEWPMLMQTGLRLGSPATTDFSWLYNFMNQCRKLNYRVDFVVVHAYWGGLSATEWYEKLKAVHDRTKLPLWIKEWNNGANWTKETWPSSQSEQYAKQLRDITAIVNMLDTCSFVERYSIYNWVEDKRMIIDKTGNLTPAGQFYADDEAPYFYNSAKEVIPEWRISEAPVLSYDSLSSAGKLQLSWTDVNGEQICGYQLRENGVDLLTTSDHTVQLEFLPFADANYTVKSIPVDESKAGLESNSVNVAVTDNDASQWLHADQVTLKSNWQPVIFMSHLTSRPLLFAGVPTYRNKLPLSTGMRHVSSLAFDASLRTWQYQHEPTFYNPDTLAYLAISCGLHTDGNMRFEANNVDEVGENWTKVSFQSSFDDVPVVLVSPQDCSTDTTFALAVRNVTRHGFEVRLRYEGNIHNEPHTESVAYLAASVGEGELCGRKVMVGITPVEAVGSNIDGGYTVSFKSPVYSLPLVYAQMQTENDTITSTLRLSNRSNSGFTIFKDREKSVAHELVKPEQVGWIVVADAATTCISNTKVASRHMSMTISGKPIDNADERKFVGMKKGKNSIDINFFNY